MFITWGGGRNVSIPAANRHDIHTLAQRALCKACYKQSAAFFVHVSVRCACDAIEMLLGWKWLKKAVSQENKSITGPAAGQCPVLYTVRPDMGYNGLCSPRPSQHDSSHGEFREAKKNKTLLSFALMGMNGKSIWRKVKKNRGPSHSFDLNFEIGLKLNPGFNWLQKVIWYIAPFSCYVSKSCVRSALIALLLLQMVSCF